MRCRLDNLPYRDKSALPEELALKQRIVKAQNIINKKRNDRVALLKQKREEREVDKLLTV